MSSAPAEEIGAARVLPVAVIDAPTAAEPMGRALKSAGLTCVEITLRTPGAIEAIQAIAGDPEMTVGAGTVLTPDQAERAVGAGARFVVSPGFSAAVVAACRQLEVPVFPGVATATELQAALEAGLDTVKLFPAESLGGVTFLRALAAPFGSVKFIPTGGINAANCSDYLGEPAVLAVGGSWMVRRDLLEADDFESIERLASEAGALARPRRAGNVAR
jgi:2-dehydro-3-deoxyphosphogluconate aldolase/(4S)-4-hydroxy-2-oxoglutarate aldolase